MTETTEEPVNPDPQPEVEGSSLPDNSDTEPAAQEEPATEEDPADAPCPVCGLRRGNRCSHV